MPNENPFQDPLRFERQVPECAIVIFGANGDLTKRKLLPALYRLAYDRRLSAGFAIVGISRTHYVRRRVPRKDARQRRAVSARTPRSTPTSGRTSRAASTTSPATSTTPDLYQRLATRLGEIEAERHTGGNVLFYLSTQPSQYAPIAHGIGAAGMGQGQRVAPTGRGEALRPRPRQRARRSPTNSTKSSRKATSTASIITWAKRRCRTSWPSASATASSSRSGTAATSTTCRSRARNPSAWKAAAPTTRRPARCDDMIQNHLLQVMATIAMEPSASFQATSVRDERSKLLRSIRPMTREEVLRNAVPGQYGPARIGGKDVPGFRQEEGVDPQSQTDTYAAVTFFVDNWRWAGVPFYVRTGKRLPKRVTEIAIQFNTAPLHLFNQDSGDAGVESADPAHPARGGHLAQVPLQAPGLRHDAAPGVDGLQLRLELRRALALGLRDAAARRHRGRRHALHAPGHGGGELERGRAHTERVARGHARTSRITKREAGARRRPTRCWRAAATCGGSRNGRERSARRHPQSNSPPCGCRKASRAMPACCAPAP